MAYDKKDAKSILAYARQLLHKRLSDFDIEIDRSTVRPGDKGLFGKWLESLYLDINPGTEPCIPDYPEAGVEVKSTKLVVKPDGLYGAGERLKLSSLNYDKIKDEEWDDSCVYHKNARMLLVGHVYEKDVYAENELIEMVSMWEFPPQDLDVIRNDWNRIRQVIKDDGVLSESLTDYLGASTAGAGGETDPKRKTRAIALKQGYMNALVRHEIYGMKYETESVLRGRRKLRKDETLEEYVINLFRPHIGKDAKELVAEFGIRANPSAKNYYSSIAQQLVRAMLGVTPTGRKPIEEFEKAEIILKTVRLRPNGVPKEHMMLRPPFEYTKIVDETWVDSALRAKMSQRFLFVVFQEGAGGKMTLKDVFFWTMPEETLDTEMRQCWQKTVDKIKAGDYLNLPKSSESKVCHVRPIALKKSDGFMAQDGKMYTKKGFWLRNTYVADIIKRRR